MSLEDLVEAHIAGEQPEVPAEIRPAFNRAIAAHEALQHALAETIVPEGIGNERLLPELPDDYEIVRELGRGGMGVVYLVRQQSLGRLVAVKVLRPGEATFGPIVRRFLDEARHLARLRHPHIVSIHEVGDARGEPYFTMDYVEGEPLSALLPRGRMSPTQALAILKPAAEAVRHAHEQGIIHRDLKPGNILVDARGQAFVTDFGLARELSGSSGLTRTGEVMGTPAYMSPEQAQGQGDRIGEATDVHALGVVLYEMLTGRPPYGQDAPANVLVRLLTQEPLAPRGIDRRIPRDLETICLKAMAKEPERRYATVRAFLEDLRRFESGESPLARRPSLIHRAWRKVRRHGRLIATVLAVAVVAVGITIGAMSSLAARRTIGSLVAEGDRRHAAGEHGLAVRFYDAALANSQGPQRPAVLSRIVRCIIDIDDPKQALELALPLAEKHPGLDFGRYNDLVASAVDARTVFIQGTLDFTGNKAQIRFKPEEKRTLELALDRFEQMLESGRGSAPERKDWETRRRALRDKLAGVSRNVPGVPLPVQPELPRGTLEELHSLTQDAKADPWKRAKAAVAEAKALEASGDRQATLEAYRRAYERIRAVFPLYPAQNDDPRFRSDVTFAPPFTGIRIPNATFDPDMLLLPETVAAIRRLDPDWPNPLRGGLRFRIEGVELPPEINVALAPRLAVPPTDPRFVEITGTRGFLLGQPVEVGTGRTAWVGVADGTYRFYLQSSGKTLLGADPKWKRLFSLLEVETAGMPETLEIHGQTIDLPPVRTRLLEEVKLLAPAAAAAMDLREGFFRWSEVPGATMYRVNFMTLKPNPHGSGTNGTSWGPVETKTNTLCLGVASGQPELLATYRRELVPGVMVQWQVDAYDASGRHLGTTVDSERRILVARGLGPQ
jgi:predicted Ser/Thr protein kinase